ncbi:TIGR03085 family metal-binding protein [Actinokineospora enzanensis]|uniref:TIGR03085 family metal-binding protein n=1 Tax=Actinokineospora enzanensis TaxID=155975 RepID=UPI00035EB6B9|nr:TIGR03085 family metal-binding protein [Actinokineospora enzanensis]
MGLAKAERAALSELFTEVGPDAPTLCAGWLTRDLAAHLVIRERRLDAAPGIVIPALAGHTERVQAGYAQRPWTELVDLVRTGPPVYSPLHWLDEQANAVEYYVHHEDVRRAATGWEPRANDAERDRALWTGLTRAARLNYRRSPVGVVLRAPDGRETTARTGPEPVTITGEPGELLLDAFGRAESTVEYSGPETSVAALRGMKRGL